MGTITADANTLMYQASYTADVYMAKGIDSIDKEFGKGYAKANPGLLAGYMLTCTLDNGSATIAKAIEYLADRGGFFSE